VRHIARKIASKLSGNIDIEDLISAGTVGLVRAARGYDPDKNAEFRTYAYIHIRGAIIDDLRSRSFVPPTAHKQIRLVREAYERLTMRDGRPPDDVELADEAGVSLDQLYQTLQDARKQQFLSIHGLDDDRPVLSSLMPVDKSRSPDAQAEHKEQLARMAKAIAELPEKDRTVLLLYYERDLTMKEIAEVLNLTESRISQLHASALFKLAMKLR